MYTAKITNKTKIADGRLNVTTEFTDGVDTFSETISPQDKVGYLHWVASRINSLNTSKELMAEDNIGKEVIMPEPVDTRTQTEKDQEAWLKAYYNLQQLNKVAELNFLTGARLTALNSKINTTKSFLDANVEVEYLDLI